MNVTGGDYIAERTVKAALFTIRNDTTIRETAKQMGVSKSTIHHDFKTRLQKIDPYLYEEIARILNINKDERHLRGGYATKEMYENRKQ